MTEVGANSYNSENGANNLFFIDLRVYVAGVLLPINSVYISSAFSNIPTATITLPPYKELFTIGRQDKVPVHIFMVNRFINDSPDDYQNKLVGEGDVKSRIGAPLLIFEGEVSGFGYLSDAGGRDMIINAQSHFCFLKDIKLSFLVGPEDIFKPIIPGEYLSTLFKSAQGSAFPLALFTHGFSLGSTASSSAPIKYPTALLENLFNVIAKSDVLINSFNPDENALINFYNKYLIKKIKIDKRLSKIPIIDNDGFPLLKLITNDQVMNQFNAYLQEGLSSNGGTLWDIIYSVFSKMEYDLSILPAPTYNPGTKILNSIIAKPMMYDALPPKCNIIFRNQIKTLRVDEITHRVPTRIRLKDISKTVISYGREGDALDLLLRLDYYPSEKYNVPTPDQENKTFPLFSSELLDTEKYTGPFLIDLQAPPWSTYSSTEQFKGKDDKVFRMSLMKSMLTLKIYENRQITLTIDYNPFIVCGAPALVWDVIPSAQDTEGLTFLGYVLSINHSISKQSMRTTVTLGYTRLIDQDFNPESRLYNTFKLLSTGTTQDPEKLDEIYDAIFGCPSMPVEDPSDKDGAYQNFYDNYYTHSIQDNPRESMSFNERRLCTMEEYMSFMGLEIIGTMNNEDGDEVITQFTNNLNSVDGYITDRKDSLLIPNLLTVQKRCFANQIYNKI